MNAAEVLDALTAHGVTLEVKGETLRTHGELTSELRKGVKANKQALVSLLEPRRTPDPPDCPEHWRHIPELPSKGEKVATVDEHGRGLRYRARLFGCWYIIRFMPNVSPEQVRATSADGKHYELPSMGDLYQALWVKTYAPRLTFREVIEMNTSPAPTSRPAHEEDAVAELLMRRALGEFTPKVRARLDEICKDNPPDALERLGRAAEYLGIDGSRADALPRPEEALR